MPGHVQPACAGTSHPWTGHPWLDVVRHGPVDRSAEMKPGPLVLIALVMSSSPAWAMGKRPRVSQEPRESRESVTAFEETADGLVFTVAVGQSTETRSPSQVGCFRAYYGAGLVACAKLCSDAD